MNGINNKIFALIVAAVSSLTILIVDWFVKFVLSQNDWALFNVKFKAILFSVFMIAVFFINLIIFLARLVSKKKNCFGRALSVIGAVACVIIICTSIILIEDSRYYHTVNRNWNISLPRDEKHLYYKDSGASFLGDGERYSVFQYKNIDEINNWVEWRSKDGSVKFYTTEILEKLEVPEEYYPDFNDDYKYYHKIKEDHSEIYIILNTSSGKVYIAESIL